jgi:Helix-turn-helix domain
MTPHTTASIPAANYTPLSKDQIAAQAIQTASGTFVPEWADARGTKMIFGFSRSHLYQLVKEGKIKSACIRRRGALKGRRLFSCESIRAFLNANIVE